MTLILTRLHCHPVLHIIQQPFQKFTEIGILLKEIQREASRNIVQKVSGQVGVIYDYHYYYYYYKIWTASTVSFKLLVSNICSV